MERIVNYFRSLWNRKDLKAAATLTGKQISIQALTPQMKMAVAIANFRSTLLPKYQKEVAHTSALTRKSMTHAYARAFDDLIMTLIPEEKKAA